jgi:hypothetical protein
MNEWEAVESERLDLARDLAGIPDEGGTFRPFVRSGRCVT